jgi:citrate synthase
MPWTYRRVRILGKFVHKGLEDVVVTTSKICFIDGENGKLLYRGYDIRDLVKYSTFEEVTFLLWFGELPTRAELEDLKRKLVEARFLPPQAFDLMRELITSHPMSALRTIVSFLQAYDEDAEDDSIEGARRKAVRLTSQIPVIVSSFERIRKGEEPIRPDPDLDHAANFLYMLKGEPPSDEEANYLDKALILHADHELNPSTFSARVTISTLSDIHSAITSAIGTLKGPLHGGANEQVIRMLRDIGSVDNVEDYIIGLLKKKERVMGFGHRVYKGIMDPRAEILREYVKEICEKTGNMGWFEMLERIREVMEREKGLYPNLDFYSGILFKSLGIPAELFTPLFAIARIVGWTSHVIEQLENNKLIRPIGYYEGYPERDFIPIDLRGG